METPPDLPPVLLCHVNLARGYRGGERQTELLVRELARSGLRQRLVARRGQPLASRLGDVEGLHTVECGAGAVQAALAIGGAGLVHVHQGRSIRGAWLHDLVTGTPYLVTRRVEKGPRAHALNRRMYRRAAAVAVLSQAIAVSVARLDPGIDPVLIPSAVAGLPSDAAQARRLREDWGGDFVVGHVGALDDSHKGQMQIVDLARRLDGTLPGARFVMVGEGPDASRLRAAAAGLRNVVFTGQVERVGDYLRAFDVFLFPSRHEGLGSILLDVLDFGIPVVATRVGGIPEVVQHSVNGFLVEAGDVEAMGETLLRLHADGGLRERLGAAGRRAAGGYSAAAMADRYLALYRSILGRKEVRTP